MVSVMMFNATFNNISILSWRSVLLVEETWVSGETNKMCFWFTNIEYIYDQKSNNWG